MDNVDRDGNSKEKIIKKSRDQKHCNKNEKCLLCVHQYWALLRKESELEGMPVETTKTEKQSKKKKKNVAKNCIMGIPEGKEKKRKQYLKK